VLSRTKKAALLFLSGLTILGCNRVPAEEALAAADRALEGARSHLREFTPDKLAVLEHSLEEARVAYAEGRYTDALRVAQELPNRIHDAVEVADGRERAAALSSTGSGPSRAAEDDPVLPPR
jgi:hypothetical protein